MKSLFISIVLLFIALTIFTQDKPKDLPTDSNKSTNQTNYSESIPYQPTVFPEKKEKKKKENDQKKEETANLIQPIAVTNQFELPIYVYDQKGIPVTDLKKEDFTLLVDDKEQPIEKVETETRPLNVILLLDLSPSTVTDDNKVYENIAFQISERLVPQNNIKIIQFTEKIKVLCEFTKNVEDCKRNDKKLDVGGGTSIYEVVETITKDNYNQKSEQTIIIILTDGIDTTSTKSNYQQSLIFAERSNATVFPLYLDTSLNVLAGSTKNSNSNSNLSSILAQILLKGSGIGAGPYHVVSKEDYELGKQYLRDITILSGGKLFEIKNLKQITKEDFDFLSKVIKPDYYLSFNFSDMISYDRRIKLKLRVNRPNLLIRTRGSRIILKESAEKKN